MKSRLWKTVFTVVWLLVLVGASWAETVIPGGTISSDTSWTNEEGKSPYRITGDITVAEGATLTIEAGVRVEFNQNIGLFILGQLQAEGTAAAPIVFTGTTETRGWWRGIQVQNAGTATVDHAVIAYSGYWQNVGLLKSGSGDVTVRNTTMRDNTGDGMRVENSTGVTTLENSTFTANTNIGLRLLNAGQINSTDCVFRNNANYGIVQSVNDTFVYTGNSFSGNSLAGVGIEGGTRATDMTLSPAGNPFRLMGNVWVGEDAALTVEAGVRVEFNQHQGLFINGTLQAGGTADAPIVFTGTTQTRGWWRGVQIENAGSATLKHCVVSYAGYWQNVGVLKSGTGGLTLENTTLLDNPHGLIIHPGYSSFASRDNVFQDNTNGVVVKTNASFDDDTSTFSGNSSWDVYLDGGNIDREVTWNLHPDYSLYLSGNTTVTATTGVLRIRPDTVVKFAQYVGIFVDGTLDVQGTAQGSVYFTDQRDDTVGGDANRDGDATAPATGWWRGIQVQNAGTATVDHAVIAYSGYWQHVGLLKSGSGNVTVHNTTMRDNTGDGMRVENSTGVTTLVNSTFTANTNIGLRLLNAGQINSTDCVFRDNANYGILQRVNDTFVYTGNSFSGNSLAGVGIEGGTRATDMTLSPAGNPFQITGNVTVAEGATLNTEPGVRMEFNQYNGLFIDGALQSVGTTAAPIVFTGTTETRGWWRGVQVQNAGTAEIEYCEVSYSGYWQNAGVLKSGTNTLTLKHSVMHNNVGDGLRIAAAPVVPEGVPDDMATGYLVSIVPRGDSVGYFVAPESFHGDWTDYRELRLQLWTQEGSSSKDIPDIFLANGEMTAQFFFEEPVGNLWKEYAVGLDDASGWQLGGGARNLIDVLQDVTTFLIRADFVDNKGEGATMSALGNVELLSLEPMQATRTSAFQNADTGGWTISHGQVFSPAEEEEDPGILVSANNTFRDNTGHGVRVGVGASFDDGTSVYADNGSWDVYLDGGTIDRETAWNVNPDHSLYVSGNIALAEAGVLRVRPGTVVKLAQYVGIFVNGVLDAKGTAGGLIHFTDARDDTVGGDANKDEDESSPSPGWWRGIQVQNAGTALLDYCQVTYSGYWQNVGVSKTGSGDLEMSHCGVFRTQGDGLRLDNSTGNYEIIRNTFSENTIGVQVRNQTESVTLSGNLIQGNTQFGVQNQSPAVEVDAQGNWWGHETGPQHATLNPDGKGDNVSDGVLFDPWRTTPSGGTILSPVRSGTLAAGDLLRFAGSTLNDSGATYQWTFSDGRTFATSAPGLLNFPEQGTVTVEYSATPDGSEDPYPDTRTFIVAENPGNLPDLRVTQVNVAGTLAVGQPAGIDYTVRNAGQGQAGTAWRDALYLSRDAYLDVHDVFLGSVSVDRTLAAGQSYQNTINVTLPTIDEGAYYLILVANDEWRVLELHRMNNEYAVAVTAQVPELTAGAASEVAYQAGLVEQYFRMTATAGQSLFLDVSNVPAGMEVFIRFGSLPTRGEYDYRLRGGERFVIPAAAAGNWYILIRGQMNEDGEYALEFDMVDMALTSSAPSRHGTETELVLSLSGVGFLYPMDVELVSKTARTSSLEAAEVEVDSFTQATATFAAGIPAGIYTVRITRGEQSTDLPDALEVVAGGEGKLEIELILPARFGYHQLATVYVDYANVGDATMPAPLLMVTATQKGKQGAIITLDQHRLADGFWTSAMPQGFSNSVQFIASGDTPGILQPGESRRVPIYYAGWQKDWDFSYPPFDWEVTVLDATNEVPVDWATLKTEMRPGYVSDAAWDVLWSNFTNLVGDDWGDYLNMLSRNAQYLYRLGYRVDNIESLLSMAMRLADGLSPLPVLSGAMDARAEGPGLSLQFERIYMQSISRRFELGDLGRGWTHNWHYRLQVEEDGTVVVSDLTGTPRIFQPDSRYTGRYLAQPGDQGVVRRTGSEGAHVYTLTEKDGSSMTYQEDAQAVRLARIQDANGNSITCTHTGGLLARLEHSSGGRLEFSRNAQGRIASVTDDQGRSVSYTYTDEYLTSVQAPDGQSATYTYNQESGSGLHALAGIGFPDGSTRTFAYDEHGRLARTYRGSAEDPQEDVRFTHGNTGRVIATDSLDNVSRAYFDHWGQIVRSENPLGEATRVLFDELRNLTSIVDPAGYETRFSYDGRGNITQVTDAMRRTTKYAYTREMNRLASVTDALGNSYAYAYDASGNRESITYPDGSQETWTYDEDGNAATWSNRRGGGVDYTYDEAGRLTRKDFQGGGSVTYTYNDRGNLAQAVDARGTTTFTYSADSGKEDYLVRIDYPDKRWLAFTYDDAGRRSSSEDQLEYRVFSHYDDLGRLAKLSTDQPGDETLLELAYDALGRVERKTMGNKVYAEYVYDAAGRLASLTNVLPDDTKLSYFAFSYDRRGNRTEMDTHYGTWTYTYDAAGQMVRAVLASDDPEQVPDQDLAYEYDALGNRVRTTLNGADEAYTANSLNQYVQVGNRTFTYDLDGNLIRESGPNGITAYIYDDENRLTGVTQGSDVWEYAYDALGNRVAVTENGATTHFVFDPIGLSNMVGEYDAEGNLLARATHGVGLVNRRTASHGDGYFTFDPMGNVSELTGANGALQNSYAYRPFGETLAQSESTPNPFRFMGQFGVQADAAGLYHARARQYDPVLGRFTAMDGLGFEAGDINVYRYAFGNPLTFLDPEGTIAISTLIGYTVGSYITYRGACEVAEANRQETAKKRDADQYDILDPRSRVNSYDNIASGTENAEKVIKFITPDPIPIPHKDKIETGIDIAKDAANKKKTWGQVFFPCSFSKDPPPKPEACPPSKDPSRTPGEAQACIPGDPGGDGGSGSAGSQDPNQKLSVAGYGDGNFVKADTQLTYRIDFENHHDAAAPAQIVTIRDNLSEHLDWESLELGEIGFGSMIIAVPSGRQYYKTTVPYAYSDDEYDFVIDVEVEAWLENGRLYFNFLSYDPETGMPPEDVGIGFLPPETDEDPDKKTGRGQGYVTYLVRPKAGLPSGTAIRNIATIQFDFGLQIDTNQVDPLDPEQGTDPEKEALVTFDGLAPTSSVNALPSVTETTTFTVSWTGEDDEFGSGVGAYDIYARDNGGAWSKWLVGTALTSAAYTGQDGHTYDFYAVATDNVGNEEVKAAQSEATTRVDAPIDPTAIPTLSQWGMAALTALLLLFGASQLRRRGVGFKTPV